MSTTKIFIAALLLMLTGCMNDIKPTVLKADAAASVKLNASSPAPVDLSELKTVHFVVIKNNENITIVMSDKDFLKLYNGYVKLGIRIQVLEDLIAEYRTFYEPVKH